MTLDSEILFLLFVRFMSDQEAWHELCNLYMAEGEFAKAAFCMEELLLHNPHNHLYHQRLAEVRYTMVCYRFISHRQKRFCTIVI